MRAAIPEYELRAPGTLDEALALLRDGWQPFAGGTDIMVLLEGGKLGHRRFVSIWNLGELRGIEETPGHVTLGALTTYADVLRHETLRREFPMLGLAAAETGAVAIQNRGTLGGNIANASPAADSPPALLVYDAEIELVSSEGARWVPYAGFHTGYKKMVMRPGELIRRIRLPRAFAGGLHYYRKVGTRRAQAISKVVVAAFGRSRDGRLADVRVAFGSVAPTTVRCPRVESAVNGAPAAPATVEAGRAALAADVAPIDDIRSTAAYRERVARNLLVDFLRKLIDS